jgi:hypothetical protein
MRNSDANQVDDVEKLLAEGKLFEGRKQALIADLLKQKEAAIAAFDDKLAKLGYQPNSGKPKRSHHRKAPAPPSNASPKAKEKG